MVCNVIDTVQVLSYGVSKTSRRKALRTNQLLKLPSNPLKFQIKNRSLWNDARDLGTADFFTTSYSGRNPQEFASSLVAAGVQSLIDIRFTPVSQYRPEFSKENLRKLMADGGIEYIHRRGLGSPPDIRGLVVGSESRDFIWEWYDQHISRAWFGRNLTDFFNSAEHPVAFNVCRGRPNILPPS